MSCAAQSGIRSICEQQCSRIFVRVSNRIHSFVLHPKASKGLQFPHDCTALAICAAAFSTGPGFGWQPSHESIMFSRRSPSQALTMAPKELAHNSAKKFDKYLSIISGLHHNKQYGDWHRPNKRGPRTPPCCVQGLATANISNKQINKQATKCLSLARLSCWQLALAAHWVNGQQERQSLKQNQNQTWELYKWQRQQQPNPYGQCAYVWVW